MKNTILLCALILYVGVFGLIDNAEAQNKRIGTAAATELLIPVGARDFAMGGATISNAYGIEAIHWNPAGLSRMKYSAEGMFSTMTYIGDIGVNYGAVGIDFSGFGVVGLTVKSLSFGDIPLTTNEDPEGLSGRLFSPSYFTIGLSYSKILTNAISVGFTTKFISEQIARVSASGIAFDFGVQYHNLANINGLQIGVAVKNIGPQMKYDGSGLLRSAVSVDGRRPEQKYKSEAASFELPSLVEMGLAYTNLIGENMSYSINGSFVNNNLYLDEYKIGGEFGYFLNQIKLFGRAGMEMVPDIAENSENIFGPTFGFGIVYSSPGLDITVDYAYRQTDFFDGNNVFSVKLGF